MEFDEFVVIKCYVSVLTMKTYYELTQYLIWKLNVKGSHFSGNWGTCHWVVYYPLCIWL